MQAGHRKFVLDLEGKMLCDHYLRPVLLQLIDFYLFVNECDRKKVKTWVVEGAKRIDSFG